MEFEFDPAKSDANLAKHGIDFVTAQTLWDDPARIEWDARSVDEPRRVVIGQIAGTTWAAVVTVREERIRIISVRRAHDDEARSYRRDHPDFGGDV